jgi:ubiquitin-protein ligase
MANPVSSAVKRIYQDLKELDREPVHGISVAIPDEDPFTLHANILISEGPYTGLLIHTIIRLPDNYPLTGPSMNIAKGLNFDHRFHEHIFNDPYNGNTICNDMLTNFGSYFNSIDHGKKKVASGWTSACTLKSVLLQMTVFFSDSDLPKQCQPTNEVIESLKTELESYKCPDCKHTTKNPLPSIQANLQDSGSNTSSKVNLASNTSSEVNLASNTSSEVNLAGNTDLLKNYRDRLTCGITKSNIFDDPSMIIGYPINVERTKYRMIFTPIIEPLSYDAYISSRDNEINKSGKKFTMMSSLGKPYNYWIPCYIDENNFNNKDKLFEECINMIKEDKVDVKGTKFDPKYALDNLVMLLNHISVAIFNGSSHESDNLLNGYCHFLQLVFYLIKKHPELTKHINTEIKKFIDGKQTKQDVPDIGVFIMKIFLSDYKLDELKSELINEYFARQVFWMQKANVKFNDNNVQNILKDRFKASEVSNRLYLFWRDISKRFINKETFEQLNTTYGIPDQKVIQDFKENIKYIKNNVTNYSTFVKEGDLLDLITSENVMVDVLNNAVKLSNQRKYTNGL